MTRPALLFVYGTLRGRAGRTGLTLGSRFLRNASIPGALHDLGEFPAVVFADGHITHGELWSCSPETLARLDAYEGVAEGLFERVRIDVEEGPAWIYVAGPGIRHRLSRRTLLRSGRWPPEA